MLLRNWLQKFVRRVSHRAVAHRPATRRRRSAGTADIQCLERRLLLSAAPVGAEFLVNTTTANDQLTYLSSQSQGHQSVAMDADGDFVAVWTSWNHDGDLYGVFGQLFHSDGTKRGTEFLINSYTTASQINAQAAMDADGDFVVTWMSFGQDGDSAGGLRAEIRVVGRSPGKQIPRQCHHGRQPTLSDGGDGHGR